MILHARFTKDDVSVSMVSLTKRSLYHRYVIVHPAEIKPEVKLSYELTPIQANKRFAKIVKALIKNKTVKFEPKNKDHELRN